MSIKNKILINTPPLVEFAMRAVQVLMKKVRRGPSGSASPAGPTNFKASAGDIKKTLAELGINQGDVVMLHSSGAEISQMGIEPSDMIDLLQEYLTTAGTLAMPSHPKLKEKDGKLIYKSKRSASTVGLLTELFRRRKDVIRSKYPFCAAAAWGARADELVKDHEFSDAPHDEKSPYGKLAEMGGKCLCIGAALDRMTILHVAEDELRKSWPIENFYDEFNVTLIDDAGEREIVAHKRSGWLWWYLAKFRWAKGMYANGFVRKANLGGVEFLAVDAAEAVGWMKDQVNRKGVRGTIYPLAKFNRILKLTAPEL